HDHKTPDVDFTKGNRLSEYEFCASLTAWKIVAVIAVIFLLVVLKGYVGVSKKALEYRKAKRAQTTVVEDFAGLSASPIKGNLDKIKNQNNNLQVLAQSTHTITPLLVEVVDVLPSGIWLNKITYTDVFPLRNSEDRSLTLEGFITAGTRDGRDDLTLGNKFRDALIEQPIIKKICGSNGSIRYSNVVGTKGDSQAPSRRANGTSTGQETRFVFTCSKAVVGGR
ncbi:MAG: hypothetical protein MJ053_06850, partial [Elusimicrobiaceae bacterium]|nr:hypothetical protein [Elusimicrobiaceae bacterium]